jgi:hypothetical protein
MKIKVSPRCWSMLASCLAAMALAACSASGGGGEGGGGGAGGEDGSSTSGSGKTTTTGTSTSTGSVSSTSGSGSGSSSSSASSSSTGGGTPAAANVIDDMEDSDGAILAVEGRLGYWYTYNDTTGKQTPEAMMPFTMSAPVKPRTGSKFAAETKGSGFTDYGAGMGFDLSAMGTTKSAYDASKYTGITFYAMAGTGGDKALRVNVSDKNTATEAGTCKKCNDHFGASIALTEDWQQYTIKFSDMKQQQFGDPQPAITTTALYSIQFQTGKNVTFDVLVDDIAFSK